MPPVNAAMRCANFEERRDRAMALFAEKGFGQVSMRELAAHVGLTAGSLYHHFPSKQDLLYDLIEELYEELQATLDQGRRAMARGASALSCLIAAHWQLHAGDPAPQFAGTLRAGAETWSGDGRAHGRAFSGLTDQNRDAGQTYVTHLPSFFVVGHVDYVRVVTLRPLGPARTELTAEWFFTEETKPETAEALENIVSFGTLVLDQDAAICAVNQRGLSALPHRHGTLMPEEYEIARFHGWVLSRTG